MSTYLKHMAGYEQNQWKSKNYDEIQNLFDKAMTRVNMFVGMDTKLVKESSKKAEMVQESSSKRAGEELVSDNSKKQKLKENVEAEVDDEAEMKKHMEIVPDDEVENDAIPLATKPPIIVDWKIIKEGNIGYFQIIRADGSSRRPKEAYERVLWGDMKVMFEHDVESKKSLLLEDKQIPSVGVFDKVFSIRKAFGGNTHNLGSFREETDKITNQHQESSRFKVSAPGDGVTIYTRRRYTSSSDGVTTFLDGVSLHRLNSDLKDYTL
ncbi:hypothetical protein Tco_0703112 [Tanacetum coccineum]|uniref:Uncharacterized protein n=1 Tax=Tanacetum coccineum TaxID=301880 RepID=A0ABQ4XYF2_9ASTR